MSGRADVCDGVRYSWHDPVVPPREQVVLRYVLERHEAERGEQTFAVFADGPDWTYRDVAAAARRCAGALHRLGVRQGDRVLCWLPNGRDAIAAWFGANWIGATYVPINTAYRGSLLEHVIVNSGARVMLCHSAFAERLDAVAKARLESVVVVDADVPSPLRDLRAIGGHVLREEAEPGQLETTRPIEPWDEQSIIYTSGTTGPSKGVLSSYCHCATTGLVCFEDKDAADLRYMVTLPLFHAGGTLGVMAPLLLGRSIAVTERFETARFWDMVCTTRSTCCTLLGAMTTFLLKEPPSPRDRTHPLKWVVVIPLAESTQDFRTRFGVDVYSLFNMTEVSAPLVTERNPLTPGTCGRPRQGVEVRLVDDSDVEVPQGAVGELIVRADQTWSMNHGYNAMPEETARAWRNGWFHTGDGFRVNEQGEFFFVDRLKDAIRRRGENISSFEVERECLAHPLVREVAAIAVRSSATEDEVMVVVAPVEGSIIDPFEFIAFLRERMAHFMVPRYIRILPELPKTPTAKVLKASLRELGVTSDTWDREQHGIVIRSERLKPPGALK